MIRILCLVALLVMIAKAPVAAASTIRSTMVLWTQVELKNDIVTLKSTLPLAHEILATDWAPARGVQLSLQVCCDDMGVLPPFLERIL